MPAAVDGDVLRPHHNVATRLLAMPRALPTSSEVVMKIIQILTNLSVVEPVYRLTRQ
jgi:hypothetical protein